MKPFHQILTVLFLFISYAGIGQEVYTADNGITASGTSTTRKVSLGGTLTGNTTIPSGGFNLNFSGTGRMGIGTDNPLNTLHVNGILNVSNPTYTSNFTIEHVANNVVRFNSSVLGEIMRMGASNTVSFGGQQLRADVRGAYFSNTLSGNALETASGKVLLNVTSGNTVIGSATDNGHKLQVNGDISLTSAQPHIISPRYTILAGDEGGGTFLFYGDNTGKAIHVGTANGNNFHKFHFQKQGQTGDDVATYNFVYNSGYAAALTVYNAAQAVTKMQVSAAGNLILDNIATVTDNGNKLQVNGKTWTTQLMIPTGAAAGKVLTSDASGNATWQTAAGGPATDAWIYGGNSVTAVSRIGNTSAQNLQIITDNQPRIHIDDGGNVGIGTVNVNDASYKLFVDVGIRTRKVKVDLLSWPDYVFHPSYKLRPLSEVEQFISNNNHLPDVPSAAEVAKAGVDLGDNQAVLLRKIEELTLYIIGQNKKLEEHTKKILQLEKEIKSKK
jgi:hypothetical protein